MASTGISRGSRSGLSLTPTTGANLAPGSTQTLTGTVNGTNLSPGTQNATLTVSGQHRLNGKLTTNTASVLIDPVYSRGIDAVTTANLGRIMAGATTLPRSLTITSTGAYLNYSNLTMNSGYGQRACRRQRQRLQRCQWRGRDLQRHDHEQFRRLTHSARTFSSSASGPVSGTAAVPGNTGLFTGETLASGTPTLPTLNVPYTATVLQQRQLSAAAGLQPVPTATTGGLLYGAWCRSHRLFGDCPLRIRTTPPACT